MTAPALSEQDARELVSRFNAVVTQADKTVKQTVRAAFADVRPIVKAFIDGRGWKALGYATWTECAPKEFGYSRGHLHRLAKAAELEAELIEGAKAGAVEMALIAGIELLPSPIGDKGEQRAIEGQLRQLDPRLASEARALAARIAMDVGRLPTPSDVAQAVEVVTKQSRDVDKEAVLRDCKYALITQRMNQGKVTPAKARAWMDALDSIAPSLRMDMLRHEVTDPAVIRGLAERGKSDTYAEIMRTGELQYADGSSVPLAKVTSRQVADLFMERSKEHRLQGKAVNETLYILSGVIVEKNPDAGTITLRIADRALAELPVGVELSIDVRWKEAKGVA